MNTEAAVTEMVNAAFKFYGGKGDAGAVVLGNKMEKQKLRIYISGAISSIDYNEAFELFEHAERVIESRGHHPVNPMKPGEKPGKTWAEYMAEDVVILDACDAIFMLHNWRQSKGARIEHSWAEICDKKIFYQGSEIWD